LRVAALLKAVRALYCSDWQSTLSRICATPSLGPAETQRLGAIACPQRPPPKTQDREFSRGPFAKWRGHPGRESFKSQAGSL
jgi:hypothetical protein